MSDEMRHALAHLECATWDQAVLWAFSICGRELPPSSGTLDERGNMRDRARQRLCDAIESLEADAHVR
jgi:hypothetical protein